MLLVDDHAMALAPEAGSALLVTGAAGSVGGYLTQFGTHEKLRVDAIAAKDDEELVGSFGAETVVPRRSTPAVHRPQHHPRSRGLVTRRHEGLRCPLALLDIGGGPLEVGFGRGRMPGFAVSLPLGASRLTAKFLTAHDPPTPVEFEALRRHLATRHIHIFC
ncbi:hypothetical protein ABZ016_26740 [Streptomyces sp. NPDC006372]|uniref:Ppx/GppA phosphatase family protein n=1 Tax=Streptomyces sp. NPDC006372 TaxID=3155599 RepID=UPI0033AB97A7